VILTILPEALRDVAQYRMVAYALALILMMILRPQGLLGVREIWDRSCWAWLSRTVRRRSGA
jgi:branched-chain amino acid transport system permease protein